MRSQNGHCSQAIYPLPKEVSYNMELPFIECAFITGPVAVPNADGIGVSTRVSCKNDGVKGRYLIMMKENVQNESLSVCQPQVGSKSTFIQFPLR